MLRADGLPPPWLYMKRWMALALSKGVTKSVRSLMVSTAVPDATNALAAQRACDIRTAALVARSGFNGEGDAATCSSASSSRSAKMSLSGLACSL